MPAVEGVVLWGSSYSAALVIRLAAARPDDVAGVVSVSGVTQPWGGVVPLLDTLGFGNLASGAPLPTLNLTNNRVFVYASQRANKR